MSLDTSRSDVAFGPRAHRLRPRSKISGLPRVIGIPFGLTNAFLLLFPTIGYYILAGIVNIFDPAGSTGTIAIRLGALVLLVLGIIHLRRGTWLPFLPVFFPGTLFLLAYGARLVENVVIQDMVIPPDTNQVLLLFLFASAIPALLMGRAALALRENDLRLLMTAYLGLFALVMALNIGDLSDVGSERLMLTKINPIALAYICSSFLLYYLVFWRASKRVLIETVLAAPFLITIIAMARSRGMMIATAATLVVYVLALRGTARIFAAVGVGAGALILAVFAFPEQFALMTEALGRIDTENDMSTAGRALSFQGAWHQFLEDPAFGRYAIELLTNYYPHNIYLEALMAVGLTGSILFAFHIAFSVRAAIAIIRDKAAPRMHLFVALLFIRDAVGAAASGAVWSASGFWITSFVIIAVRSRIRRSHA